MLSEQSEEQSEKSSTFYIDAKDLICLLVTKTCLCLSFQESYEYKLLTILRNSIFVSFTKEPLLSLCLGPLSYSDLY